MTRDETIRMAREAGWDMEWGGTTIEQVTAFATLVAAAEREACAADCLVNDHTALIKENKQLRDELEILTHAVEERRLDYELLTEHYRELLADLAAIRARGDA